MEYADLVDDFQVGCFSICRVAKLDDEVTVASILLNCLRNQGLPLCTNHAIHPFCLDLKYII